MTRLCKAAGIEGFKTNHSLRATTATRLYNSGVDEQLVMERTGHRSIEGDYKRTSEEQRQTLSDILNQSCKQPRLESYSPPQAQSSVVPYTPDVACSPSAVVACSSSKLDHTSASQYVATCSSTNIQNNSKQNLPGTFNFNNCPSATFNINY